MPSPIWKLLSDSNFVRDVVRITSVFASDSYETFVLFSQERGVHPKWWTLFFHLKTLNMVTISGKSVLILKQFRLILTI